MAVASGAYDVVMALEIVEHVADPAQFIATCRDLVKPGGLLIQSTLNRTAKSFGAAIIGAEWIMRWLPKGTHEFAKFIRPSELAGYCRDAGLVLEESKGLQYNPLTQRYWVSDDTSVNYMIATRKPA